MKIDFVCPVKIDSDQRHRLLIQTFESLFENTAPENIGKVVVIDDNSQIPLKWKDEWLQKDNFFVFSNIQQLGVGGSKNRAVEWLLNRYDRGDLLYIFDADIYFTKGWDEKMLDALVKNKEKVKILGGGIHPYLQPRPGEETTLITSHDAVSGWSWMLYYDTWVDYGKMADNALGTGKSEDWEYCQRVRNDGFWVGCLKQQVIAHCGLTNTEGQQIVGYNESLELIKKVAPEAFYL